MTLSTRALSRSLLYSKLHVVYVVFSLSFVVFVVLHVLNAVFEVTYLL